jgi:hypothetical protein
MEFVPDEVIARWTSDGRIVPQGFTWQGRVYQVDSVGRSWQDEQGDHMLVMVPGGQVFQLSYQAGHGWKLRPPRRSGPSGREGERTMA